MPHSEDIRVQAQPASPSDAGESCCHLMPPLPKCITSPDKAAMAQHLRPAASPYASDLSQDAAAAAIVMPGPATRERNGTSGPSGETSGATTHNCILLTSGEHVPMTNECYASLGNGLMANQDGHQAFDSLSRVAGNNRPTFALGERPRALRRDRNGNHA
ncbi:hypothetical protein BKA66DRAFT_548461 [Pyrenochaeta sp. MPI-SDFR-AT-0127]|nr:hypothetical protein BKA66DRAFT_548461 [Pyrenochaeta sp. MPI-SDFR-AT-0127]